MCTLASSPYITLHTPKIRMDEVFIPILFSLVILKSTKIISRQVYILRIKHDLGNLFIITLPTENDVIYVKELLKTNTDIYGEFR